MIGTGTRGVDDGFVTRIARWVSWHAVVVDHFYLYLDGIDATFDARFAASVDGSASFGLLRDKAASQKSVRLGNWGLQQQRFAQCALVGKQTSEWMGFIDDDEFVVPVHGFAQMLRELPPPVDAIYMLWEMKCGNRSVTDRKRYRLSGKSFIKPVHFRDARHERTGMTTNGIISKKSNSIHRWVPLASTYNASERMVGFSPTPDLFQCGKWGGGSKLGGRPVAREWAHDCPCGSYEIGTDQPCREIRSSYTLEHRRETSTTSSTPHRRRGCWRH